MGKRYWLYLLAPDEPRDAATLDAAVNWVDADEQLHTKYFQTEAEARAFVETLLAVQQVRWLQALKQV